MCMNQRPSTVSLLRSENEAIVEQPYAMKVDFERVIFDKIKRAKFWYLINNQPICQNLLSQTNRCQY